MNEKTRFFILLALLFCSVGLAVFLYFYTNNAAINTLGS